MGYTVIHKTDSLLNKEKLDAILEAKNLGYKELYNEVIKEHGLRLEYKSFMNLLANNVTWKLHYARAICRTLDVQIDDIFDYVEVDVEEKAKEKEEWKEKYEKKRTS